MDALFEAVEGAVTGIADSLRENPHGDKDGAILLLENILSSICITSILFCQQVDSTVTSLLWPIA